MKKLFITLFLGLSLWLPVQAEESIASLRGTHDLTALSENATESDIILPEGGVLPRDFPHQPPMIPHTAEKARISLMKNQCLGCHGKLEFKEVGATEIGENHYINRKGEKLGSISTRYYFCTQCHASQVDKDPLIENKFQSIMKQKEDAGDAKEPAADAAAAGKATDK